MLAEYGSDVVVDLLRAFGIEYAALNPGATFRGLHDSLVNYGGDRRPELILCCHEEIAVSLAHGYAKATGRPMAAIVHNVVGLQHAAMAIFNAFGERGGDPRGLHARLADRDHGAAGAGLPLPGRRAPGGATHGPHRDAGPRAVRP